jgi:[NiFe] hydrogenase assembly HybE family chaperone
VGTSAGNLVDFYQGVFDDRFRDLPIVNPALELEAVGFRGLDEHELGVLITPWFMNLVLLPGTDRWDARPQGSVCQIELPGGKVEFTVSHDDVLGTTLSAALFSSVADFPDQTLAREVARETLRLLRSPDRSDTRAAKEKLSRRELFQRLTDNEEDAK